MSGNYISSDPFLSLDTQSALNTTGGVLDNAQPHASHSLFVVSSTGVSAGVVSLEISNDNANWFTTSSTVTTNAASKAFAVGLADFPARFVRAKITTGITGGTVQAYVASA